VSPPAPRPIDPDVPPAAPVRAWIALGSNVGDRAAHLEHAFDAIARVPGVHRVRRSSIRETDPVGPPGQGPYLNAVAEVETTLAPRAVLAALLAIERERGRDRTQEVRFGPRTLDLDLLAWGGAVPGGPEAIDVPGLTVPHPRMHARAFVLEPLAELAPSLAHAAASACVHFPAEPDART
jgi:2-amino-4-hydroxy-6-hydroxymethyldihydropteridine diphosphokinase